MAGGYLSTPPADHYVANAPRGSSNRDGVTYATDRRAMQTEQAMTAEEFMERHGEQVLTALRHQVDFWVKAANEFPDESVRPIAEDQIKAWQEILDRAQAVVA